MEKGFPLSGKPLADSGGADRDRTDDLLNAIQALSQLSYSPNMQQITLEYGRRKINPPFSRLPRPPAVRGVPRGAHGRRRRPGDLNLPRREKVDGVLPEQVRPAPPKHPPAPVGRQVVGPLDRHPVLRAILGEVENRAEVDVRRVVPLEREELGLRHPPVGEQVEPHLPVGEVGKPHDPLLPHAQDLREDHVGFFDRLERLVQDDVVEGAVRVVAQSLVDVALHDGEPLGDAGADPLLGDLDPAAGHPFLADELHEARPVAAPQVQDLLSRRDEIEDDAVVDPRPFGHYEDAASRMPILSATLARRFVRILDISPSSSRKASCPYRESISKYVTPTPLIISAFTIPRAW